MGKLVYRIDVTLPMEEFPISESLQEICGNGEISVRTYHVLSRQGINTIEQLIHLASWELLEYRNFGRICLQEVENMLAKRELSLRPSKKPP